jgi:hypothetical protein
MFKIKVARAVLAAAGFQILCAGCILDPQPSESELVGRNYYAFQENYTCTTAAPDSTPVPSWKDHLLFFRDTESGGLMVQFLGDACNDFTEDKAYDSAEFDFSPDLITLTYQGKTYEYRAQIPQF